MFTKVTARIAKTAALGLVVATIGMGIIGGSGHAYAMDNSEGAGASCMYEGKEYSDGAVIRQADGALYKCKDGSWVFECAGCATGAAGHASVLTQQGGVVVKQGNVLTQQSGIQRFHVAP
jgi:hypothetical protein